jgi:uncharacterized sulfatase
MKISLNHLALPFAGLAATQPALSEEPAKRPNMVLFIADDLTYFDIGCYGGQAKTPNIDRLAEEGIRFNMCYQAVAVSAPTRHNIYTGLYPVTSGAYPQAGFVKEGTKSVAHYLSDLGYRVALIGKRHIQPLSAFPFEYLDDGDTPLIDWNKVDAFIKDCGNQPFLLVAASKEPHYEWDRGDTTMYKPDRLILPPNWIDTRETREFYKRYLAETTFLDGEVGELDAVIRKNRITDNTALMFISEQGSSFPYSKWTCYEAGVHAGFVVRWPGVAKPGSTTDALVEYTDFVPTFIEMAGGTPSKVLQGSSILDVIKGGDGGKEYAFSMQTTRGEPWGGDHFGVRCVRDERYTYIINFSPDALFENHLTRYGDGFFNSWREAAWHDPAADKIFLGYITRPAVELYDRSSDPFEMNNLAGKPDYAEIENRLSVALENWMKECGDEGQKTEMEALEHTFKYYLQLHPEENKNR